MLKNLLTQQVLHHWYVLYRNKVQIQNKHLTWENFRLSRKECRITNWSLAKEERKDRGTSKISYGVWGEKNPTHKHPHTPSPVPSKYSVSTLANAVSPSALRTYQPQQIVTSVLFRITLFANTHHHTTLPGTNISTDELLWTLKSEGWLQAAAAKPVAVWPLPSVYMGRTECHRPYTLWFRVDSKQLCTASLKPYLSHVFGSCSYLNYPLEMLNSSFPHFSVTIKTATKWPGKTSLMWGAGCPMPAPIRLQLRAGIQY